MTGLYDDVFVEELRTGAQDLVAEWGLSPRSVVSLLHLSENATFRVDDPETGARVVLRVHRPGYHNRQEIESELVWLADLIDGGIVNAPRPYQTRSGGYIAEFKNCGESRQVVGFAFMPGREPSPTDDLSDSFRRLGTITARLHDHARRWKSPAGFQRKTWNFDTTIGRTAYWGDWRDGLGLTIEGREVLQRTAKELETKLHIWGTGPERFGLIHADLRLANLLIEDQQIAVIDFDDCGFGWFGFDFAAAVSFIETDDSIPDLQTAWVEGYRCCAEFADADVAMLPVFVMLRRLQLTAWIASHSETPTAQAMGVAYIEGTIELADRFLSTT